MKETTAVVTVLIALGICVAVISCIGIKYNHEIKETFIENGYYQVPNIGNVGYLWVK